MRQDARHPKSASTPGRASDRWLPGRVRLVHEDSDLLVIDKPSGIVTASLPHQHVPSVFDVVKKHVRDRAKRRGTRVWIIHRLDKEASGLLVFAKSDRAFAWLKEQFRARHVQRHYEAVVEGVMTPEAGAASAVGRTGAVRSFLYEDAQGLMRSSPTPTPPQGPRGKPAPRADSADESAESEGEGAKLAVTHYRVLAVGHGRTLVRCKLDTGRKNQIRVHMADLGHPIVGDRRFGAATDPLERVCLHAAELSFTHPGTGQALTFQSPTPGSFRGLVGEAPAPDQAPPPPSVTLTPAAPAPKRPSSQESSWDHVADWYDQLIDERGSDHHERVILPGTLRLLGEASGRRVLDLACGQGILARRLAALGAQVVGLDASPKLIDAAHRASTGLSPRPQFVVGDARALAAAVTPPFDAAACVMALMNIEPLAPVLAGVAGVLRPGGAFVSIILHPAFRAPGQTSWGWDSPAGGTTRRDGPPKGHANQFRRVDGYLTPAQREIVMNPGEAASQKPAVTTLTYHRPIQTYVRLLAEQGLLVSALEEWPSLRTSQPGPRADEENRARREIPMFLAIRAVKTPATAPA